MLLAFPLDLKGLGPLYLSEEVVDHVIEGVAVVAHEQLAQLGRKVLHQSKENDLPVQVEVEVLQLLDLVGPVYQLQHVLSQEVLVRLFGEAVESSVDLLLDLLHNLLVFQVALILDDVGIPRVVEEVQEYLEQLVALGLKLGLLDVLAEEVYLM